MNSQGSQEKNRAQTVHVDKKRRNPWQAARDLV